MGLRNRAAREPDAAAPAEPVIAAAGMPDAVMNTVFRADGTILLQNPASRHGFAAPGDGANPFLRHFVSRRNATQLLNRLVGGETVRAELAVHTTAGIRHLRFVATPLAGGDGEPCFLLNEAPFAPSIPQSDEQHLRDYAEAAADWFWEMDAELCFTFMS